MWRHFSVGNASLWPIMARATRSVPRGVSVIANHITFIEFDKIRWLVDTIPGWKSCNFIGRFQNIPRGFTKIPNLFGVCWMGTLVMFVVPQLCFSWSSPPNPPQKNVCMLFLLTFASYTITHLCSVCLCVLSTCYTSIYSAILTFCTRYDCVGGGEPLGHYFFLVECCSSLS